MTDETGAPTTQLDELPTEGDWSQVWERCQGVLEETVTSQQRAFIGLSKLDGVVGDTALISVPHQFAKDVIEARLRQVITSVLSEQVGRDLRIAVVVDPSLDASAEPSEPDPTPAAAVPGGLPDHERSPDQPPHDTPGTGREPGARRETEPTRLNPKYTFETFVIGSSNRFAHAAAVAVAEAPGQGLQPAVHLRRLRAGQDPPAARDRPLRAQPLHRRPGALRVAARSSPTTSSTRSATTSSDGVPAPLPRRRRAADRRHPVPGGQGARPRRSSSTPSTRCTTPTSRS